MKENFKISVILFVAILFLGLQSQAQELWSVEKCVNYAIENNIQIKQQTLNVTYGENQLKQSKHDLIPSLGAQVGQGFSFGRSLNVQNNTYSDINSSNTNFYLSTDVTLFNGMAKQNTIKQRNYELQASLQDLKKAKDDISLRVVSAYLEILFNKELLETSTKQLEVTRQQIEYNKKQVEAGNMARGKLLETEAQEASEELSITNYENQLKLSLLNLMQLLELPITDDFDIVFPTFEASLLDQEVVTSNQVFEKAVTERPEILSRELKMKSMERQTAIAKAQLYPSLGLSAYYTNDYQNYEGNERSFSEQFKNNGKEAVNLTLRIPIFGGLSAKTNFKNSFISYENSKYELQLEKNNLLKEIQQVQINALAAMKKYYSSEKAVKSTEEAFRYVEEKFNLGIVTPLEYNDAKNKVTNAQSSFIQSKYEYIFRIKILDFYNGKEITL
jgi:outer membrane protein